MNANRLSALLVAGISLVYAACGGNNLTLPSEGEPAHISVTHGNRQSARVGTPLPQPVVVKVTDTQDRPVVGATVDFTFDDVTAGGSATPSSATTDADGEASSSITLGTRVGSVSGHARVPVPQGIVPVETAFTATALSADANGIAAVSGDAQTGQIGTQLGAPLIVQVTDAFGNPISGVTVGWSVTGGGSVSESSVQTGENGQAAVMRTLGNTAGQQTTLATAEGLAGSPVTFTHTATAGSASRIELVSGNNQSGPAGAELDQPLVVRLLDDKNNPIPNRPVSWVVGNGGGSAAPQTSNTDGQGLASTAWTLGPTPGSNTLNAVVSGVGTVTFTATGTGTGSPSTLALRTQPPSSVTVGAVLDPNPTVQVKDAAGNDVAIAGVEITVGIASGGGRLEGTQTQTTDGNGRAQFNDLRITGATGSHRLIFAADGYRSVTSNKIEVNKASTTTTITADDPDPSNSGDQVTVRFTVTSGAGTPTGRVDVTVSGGAATCNATVAEGSCQVRLVATGERTLAATYRGDALFAASSGTAPHTVNQANLPPVAQNDPDDGGAYQTSINQPLTIPDIAGTQEGILANDSDPEFQDLTAELRTQPIHGSVTLSGPGNGTFTYTPNLDYIGPDSFTYRVTDEMGAASNDATVQIQVNQ